MRPQEPPPYRSRGAGDDPSRPDGPGPFGPAGYDGRGSAQARPVDEHGLTDPYGDVPVPPRPSGAPGPYGSGRNGPDAHALGPPGPPDRHASADGPSFAPARAAGYGAPGYDPRPAQGPGFAYGPISGGGANSGGYADVNGYGDVDGYRNDSPYGQRPPSTGELRRVGAAPGTSGGITNGFTGGPVGRPEPTAPGEGASHGVSRPPWAGAAPPPGPLGAPHPDRRPDGPPSGAPIGTNGHAVRPPGPPPGGRGLGGGPGPASGPGVPASPAGGSGPDATAPGTPSSSSPEPALPGASATSSTPASDRVDEDGGLAGSNGFASRPHKPGDPPTSSSTATTSITPGAGAGPDAGRHRRGAGTGPGRGEDAPDEGDGSVDRTPLRGDRRGDDKGAKGKKKRKGSFWRELPLLIVVAIVLTFVIQTFLARIYVIPSASMERTLHGCNGCANDRVAVDKITYRFSNPSPGDVVVFRGPPAWGDNDELGGGERSSNVLIRGLQSGLSLVGLAPPDEKDFVKRVVAVGGQTVACCDPQNRVTVDGRPLNEPYVYYQPNLGRTQSDFAPVRVPEGQLWVMGDNRNNSADARVHGPVGVADVIGKARVIVLPVGRWGGVPDTDPQAQPSALGAPTWTSAAPAAAGVLGAVPLVGVSRRLRRRWSRLGGGARGPDGRDPLLDRRAGGPDEPPPSARPGR